MVPLTFGLPTADTLAAAARGAVILGGCCPPLPPVPRLACPRCGVYVQDVSNTNKTSSDD